MRGSSRAHWTRGSGQKPRPREHPAPEDGKKELLISSAARMGAHLFLLDLESKEDHPRGSTPRTPPVCWSLTDCLHSLLIHSSGDLKTELLTPPLGASLGPGLPAGSFQSKDRGPVTILRYVRLYTQAAARSEYPSHIHLFKRVNGWKENSRSSGSSLIVSNRITAISLLEKASGSPLPQAHVPGLVLNAARVGTALTQGFFLFPFLQQITHLF